MKSLMIVLFCTAYITVQAKELPERVSDATLSSLSRYLDGMHHQLHDANKKLDDAQKKMLEAEKELQDAMKNIYVIPEGDVTAVDVDPDIAIAADPSIVPKMVHWAAKNEKAANLGEMVTGSIPEIHIPERTIPGIHIPDINIPKISIPECNIPEVNVPER